MKERPILFNGEMVRAILDGRKTQTRRILKKQPLEILPMHVPNQWVTLDTRDPNHGSVIKCRFGNPGDQLWVRETWSAVSLDSRSRKIGITYRSDGELSPASIAHPCSVPIDKWEQANRWFEKGRKWHPSIFMPRWASRILLEITEVRVEKIQDISESDAIKEGIEPKDPNHVTSAHYRFVGLWNEINAKRGYSWDSNPWVWVIEFEIVK